MNELKAETSTQKLFWDSENEIVWGELFGDQVTEELAKENVDAQETVRDGLNRTKTRVLIDMTAITEISKEARDYFANEKNGLNSAGHCIADKLASKPGHWKLLHGPEHADHAN